MKRILSFILTAAMLFSLIAVSVSAAIDHTVVAEDSKSVFKAELSTQETLMPGDTFSLTVSADSFWGDQSLTTEDADLGEVTGAYGPAIFTIGTVFDTSAINVTGAPKLVTDTTVGNGEYMSAVMPSKSNMNKTGFGCVNVTASQITNDDETAYITFYGSGDIVTFNFQVLDTALPGTYYIYIGDYAEGSESSYDEIVGGVYVKHSAQVDPYADKIALDKAEYPGAIAITVGSNASEEDTAAAAAVDALIDAIGTVQFKSTTTTDESYVHVDAMNQSGFYMHAPMVGSTGNFTVDLEFYAANASVNGYGFIGGDTSTDSGEARCFYNTGTKTFMIAKNNNWMNSESVVEVLAESEVIECADGEFLKAKFIYNGTTMSIECNGEVVCSAENVPTNYSFYIFYPSKCDFYIKSVTITEGDATTTATDEAGVRALFGDTSHAGITTKTFSYYADSNEKITAAETAYAALTDLQKALVTGYADLTAARAEYDAAAAAEVDGLIDAIGTVKFNPLDATVDSLAAIVAAEEAYAALSDAQKALVTKYETLTAARARWEELNTRNDQANAADVDALIEAIGEVNFASRDAISAARAAYEALTETQKGYVTLLATLVAAEETYEMYGPIMVAENAIKSITKLVQTTNAYHLNYALGYSNMVDANGGAIGTEGDVDGTVGGIDMSFDFMYVSYDVDETPYIGFCMNGENVGYDIKNQRFFIGYAGFNEAATGDNIIDSHDYALAPYVWASMRIVTTVDGDVTLYVDDVAVCEAKGLDINFHLFWMENSECYIANFTSDFGRFGCEMGFVPVVIDINSPYDQYATIQAAQDAVDALTEEQYALLSDEYKAALQAAKDEYAALNQELIDAAAAVDALIGAIATPEDAAAATAAYNALLPTAKTYVTKYADLQAANVTIVENMIAALGEITLDSVDAIVAAEAAYAALTDDEKAAVENLDTLTAARAAYTALRAAEVDAMIAALGEITLDSVDAIVAAEQAYAALTDAEKAAVENYATLTAARDAYTILRAAEVDAMIAALGEIEITLDSEDAIAAVESAYAGLSNAEKAAVKNYADLTAARAALNTLRNDITAVENRIDSLYVGGTTTKLGYINDSIGAYSQLDPNPGTTPYIFAFAMTAPTAIDNAEAEDEAHHIGGATNNDNWAGYDIDRQAFVIAKHGVFNKNMIADDAVLDSHEMALEAGVWYYVEFTYGADYVAIAVDGTEVARASVDRSADDWYIFYPRWSEANFDSFTYTLDGIPMEMTNDFTKTGGTYWACSSDTGVWSVATVEEATLSADAVAAVRAMYDALTDEQKVYVNNYDKLTALESTPADEAQALIDAIVYNEVTLADQSVLDAKDDIAAAYAAYNALTAEEQAEVDATALFAALKAYNKALVYDATLNGKLVAPVINAEGAEDAINVSWDAIDGATAYWVYVDGVIVLKTTGTSATIPASVGEHTVKVQVAVNYDADAVGIYGGYVSGTSAEATVTVVEGYRFATSAEVVDGAIAIDWNDYEGASLYYVMIENVDTGLVTTFKFADTTVTEFTMPAYALSSTNYDVYVIAYANGKFINTNTVSVVRG